MESRISKDQHEIKTVTGKFSIFIPLCSHHSNMLDIALLLEMCCLNEPVGWSVNFIKILGLI